MTTPLIRTFDPDFEFTPAAPPAPTGDLPVPQNAPAERAVITCLFEQPDDLLYVQTVLQPTDFFDLPCRYIYEAMQALLAARVRPTISTVSSELTAAGRWAAVGGDAVIFQLAVMTGVNTSRIDYYAEKVAAAALGRELIQAGGRIAGLGYTADATPGELIGQAEATLIAATQRRQPLPVRTLEQVFSRYLNQPAPAVTSGAVTGVPMGYRRLDAMTGGLQPSDLVIVAARPSIGKSSFGLSAAYHAAAQHGKRIGIFSLEMSADQLGQRLLAIKTGVPAQAVRLQTFQQREWYQISTAMGALGQTPIFFDDSARLSLADLRRRARLLHYQEGIDLFIIDYIQLMQATDSRGRRLDPVAEVTEITQTLKQLGRDLKVPILAMSQLSRAVENRDNKIPQLSDLRQSGSIEQDADIVMFIYRDEVYHPDGDRQGWADIIVAKHRNGPLGVVPLRFHGPTTYFYDPDGDPA